MTDSIGSVPPYPPVPPPPPTGLVATVPDTNLALLCHLGSLIGGFIVPLIIYIVKKDEDPFIRHHAAEALNFQITLAIAGIVSFVLIFVLIGFLLFPIVMILAFVLPIMATISASRGELYRYPLTLHIIN